MRKLSHNLLKIDLRGMKDFQEKHSKKVQFGNDFIHSASLVAHTLLKSEIGFTQNLLIQDINLHFLETLRFCMRGEGKIALSTLRISSEMTRDLLRLLEDPKRETLYHEGRQSQDKPTRKLFRKTFQFSIPDEDSLKEVYDWSSNFGIHGRIPILDSLGVIEDLNGKSFTKLNQNNSSESTFMISMCFISLVLPKIMIGANHYIKENNEANKLAVMWKSGWNEITDEFSKYIKIWANKSDFKKSH
ncbi:hypothetical protein OAV68_01285 [bacterium]|jgi:hypothetical protein|nr:hypothetical protein [bacterium]